MTSSNLVTTSLDGSLAMTRFLCQDDSERYTTDDNGQRTGLARLAGLELMPRFISYDSCLPHDGPSNLGSNLSDWLPISAPKAIAAQLPRLADDDRRRAPDLLGAQFPGNSTLISPFSTLPEYITLDSFVSASPAPTLVRIARATNCGLRICRCAGAVAPYLHFNYTCSGLSTAVCCLVFPKHSDSQTYRTTRQHSIGAQHGYYTQPRPYQVRLLPLPFPLQSGVFKAAPQFSIIAD